MTTPRAALPTLRAFLGQLALVKTTAVSTYRSLFSLEGGLTQNDTDVSDVVNALVTAVDPLPRGFAETAASAYGTTKTGLDSVVHHVTTTAGVETAASWAIGSGPSAAYLFAFDVTAVSDDGLDFATYKFFHSVSWDGATLAELHAPDSLIAYETSAASCSCTSDISGTSVRLRVGAVAGWRYGASIRYTRTTFT